ncbi:MAG: twin transmembrane helix small protein [Woeseiaceae bacterium]|nr:twin transmembrane helix small protein [Woeseiaceae bacterium]
MKIIILLLLAAIVVSLASGLFFLTKSEGEDNSPKLLRALKIRVVLSILLIAVLVASFFFGWIPMPDVTAPSDAAAGP